MLRVAGTSARITSYRMPRHIAPTELARSFVEGLRQLNLQLFDGGAAPLSRVSLDRAALNRDEDRYFFGALGFESSSSARSLDLAMRDLERRYAHILRADSMREARKRRAAELRRDRKRRRYVADLHAAIRDV